MFSTFVTFLAAASASAIPQSYQETVTAVVDGDTLAIEAPWSPFPNLHWKIRVAGVDTPEKGARAQCLAERIKADKASQVTKSLIAQSRNRVTISGVHHDKYGGRFVAKVTLADGRNLADVLIKAGLARAYDGGKKQSWCSRV